MSPKKRILLVDSDEARMGVRSFVLLQHGYAVVKAENRRGALSRLARGCFEAAIVRILDADLMDRLTTAGCNVLLLATAAEGVDLAAHAACWMPPTATTLELLEGLRVIAARRRGPRKGAQRAATALAVSTRKGSVA